MKSIFTILSLLLCLSSLAQKIGITIDGIEYKLKPDTIYIYHKDTVYIPNPGTNYTADTYTFVGKGEDDARPYLSFMDNLTPSVGTSRHRINMRFDALEPHPENPPFLFTQGINSFGPWPGNNTAMWGWNLGPGGGAYWHGRPAIGYSVEQNYRPNGPGQGLTESHSYYVSPEGKQVRLFSYTINNNNGHVDYYKTVSNLYLKNPDNGSIYFRVVPGEQRIYGRDPAIKMGDGDHGFQLISGNGQLSLFKNTGLRLEKLKAPPGQKYYLKIDENGDVYTSPY